MTCVVVDWCKYLFAGKSLAKPAVHHAFDAGNFQNSHLVSDRQTETSIGESGLEVGHNLQS